MIIKENSENAAKIAAKALKNGQIICFATDTVYALACDASSDIAVRNLYLIKERDPQKPIAIFAKNLECAKEFLLFNELEEKIAKQLMPGMVTLILNKKNQNTKYLSELLNNNASNLGLRIPNHKFCLDLLNEFNGIIAATSANVSNKKPAVNFIEAKKYFDNKVDLIIDGGACQHKVASTVLKVNNDKVEIIRAGLVMSFQNINN